MLNLSTYHLTLNQDISSFSKDKSTLDLLRRKATQQETRFQDILAMKDKKAQLKMVSQEMESLMIKMMFKNMKKTLEKTGMLHGGYAEEIFDDMLMDEHSNMTVKNQSLGIAKLIYNQNVKYVNP